MRRYALYRVPVQVLFIHLCFVVFQCFLKMPSLMRLCFFSVAVSAFVEAFDEIVNGPLAQYVSLSQKIGDDVKTHVSGSLKTEFLHIYYK